MAEALFVEPDRNHILYNQISQRLLSFSCLFDDAGVCVCGGVWGILVRIGM